MIACPLLLTRNSLVNQSEAASNAYRTPPHKLECFPGLTRRRPAPARENATLSRHRCTIVSSSKRLRPSPMTPGSHSEPTAVSSPSSFSSRTLGPARPLLLGQMSPPSRSSGAGPPARCNTPSGIFRNALSSTLGASVVATVVTPLDVVKVRLQAHVCPVGGASPCEDPKHVEGSLDAARKIIRSDGVRGLWRGLNVTLLLAIPTTGLYFTLYEAFREQISSSYPDASKAATAITAGAGARIAAASASSPLELARTSLQAGVGGPNATVLSVLKHVRKNDGFLALWRGLGPTLLRDAPFSAIYWSTYEGLKDPQRSILPHGMFSSGNDFAVYLGSGIGAGALAAMCTVPADVIKTRRQSSFTQGPNGRSISPSPFMIARQIFQDEGVRGLFRGAGPRVAKVAPACAIMMGSYEFFRKLF